MSFSYLSLLCRVLYSRALDMRNQHFRSMKLFSEHSISKQSKHEIGTILWYLNSKYSTCTYDFQYEFCGKKPFLLPGKKSIHENTILKW